MHRLDVGVYCYLKEFWGDGVRTHVNSGGGGGEIPSTGDSEKIEPTTLHHLGQRAHHATDRAIPAPSKNSRFLLLFVGYA